MSDLESGIRRLIGAYLGGELSYEAFVSEFAIASWDVPETDPAARAVIYRTELLLAEHTSGHRSELSVKGELLHLVEVRDKEWVRATGTTASGLVTIPLLARLGLTSVMSPEPASATANEPRFE